MTHLDTIIIPFRSLADGKTRLSPLLDPMERMDLSRSMLDTVIEAAMLVRPMASVIVVTPDPDALSMLEQRREANLRPLWQPPDVFGLNGALTLATAQAIGEGARTVVVLPADLPLIQARDIEHLLRRDAAVVVAPDRHLEGTNGLMQRIDATRGRFVYHFGVGSFHAHLEEAHRLELDAATSIALGTSFDLDTPIDLGDYRALQADHGMTHREAAMHG